MSRFAQLAAGTHARKTVHLEIAGQAVAIDVRVLGPFEWGDALAGAHAYAVSKGVEKPEEDDPLYELGLHVHVLFRACVDTDSPKDAPAPFFDSPAQILESALLSRDHIALLFAEQEAWETECSPRTNELTKTEFTRVIATAAQGDLGPFSRLRPGMQLLCMRSLAALYFSSQQARSASSPAC